LLTDDEIELIVKLVAAGVRPNSNASFAKKLGMSISTWKTIKTERQRVEINEACERGLDLLHDYLINSELAIAMNSPDPRERRQATEFLLASRYQYRSHGETTVNVGVDVGRGPELVVIQEILRPTPQQVLGALAIDDPMLNSPHAPKETVPVQPRAATEGEVALSSAWADDRK
jgi:hypothetical protein